VASSPSPRPCAPQQLRATYTFVFGSPGLGSESYLLTVTNKSKTASCTLHGPLAVRLLGRRGTALPTEASSYPAGAYKVVLAPGQWAQAETRFSEDVPATGENPRHCEPVAYSLRLTIGHGTVLAPMDPTMVCQHGRTGFNRLKAVTPVPTCNASSLQATFKRYGPFGATLNYALILTNTTGSACYTDSFVHLALLGASGNTMLTHPVIGVQSPYVLPAHAERWTIAMMHTKPGPGEPHSGGCEPIASNLLITPRPGIGSITIPVQPALRVCYKGQMTLSGLFQQG
jgi:hypothetical protein